MSHRAVLVLAFEGLQLHRQSLKYGILLGGAGRAAAPRARGAALRVRALEELAHEAEAGLADVGAAGENVEDGVDGAAEVGESRDIGAGGFGGVGHRIFALQETDHLEESGGRGESRATRDVGVEGAG